MLHLMCKHTYKCVFFQCTYLYYNSCLVQLQNSSINLNTKYDDIVYTTECARPAKLSKIQAGGGGGCRGVAKFDKGWVAIIFNFCAIKISTFWNFYAKWLKRPTFENFT